MPEAKRRDRAHGLDLRAVARVIAALGATVLACAAVAFFAWRAAAPAPRLLAPNANAQVRVAGVALEPSPRAVRAAYDADKDRLLHAREWVDAGAGIARIPIETAMRVLAQRDAARRAAAPEASRK